jgi:hypothetical protein
MLIVNFVLFIDYLNDQKKAYEFNANKVLSEKCVASKNIFYVWKTE